jgi:hypothetical protein
LGLLLVPACGGHGLSSSQDATPGSDVGADVAADLRPADQAPTSSEDLAPPAPDLRQGPDLRANDPLPPSDPPLPRDLPGDPVATGDLPEVSVRDLLPSEYRSLDEPPRPDLPEDRPPSTDLPTDPSPITDLPPNLDKAPAYDLPNIPDELPRPDVYVSPDAQVLADLCTSTGGTLDAQSCCQGVSDFREMCTTAVGSCGCSPASSHSVAVCVCPQPGCFMPAYGCVGPGSTCTVGMDQTCNDNLFISSTRGRCVENGRCVCTTGMSTTSGKCL